MPFKGVIFNLSGVLIRKIRFEISKYEKKLGTPPGFLDEVFMKDASDNNDSYHRLERGDLLLSDFLSDFEADVKNAARKKNVELRGFNPTELFDPIVSLDESFLDSDVLSAVKILKMNHIKTGAVISFWIDDRDEKKLQQGNFMGRIRRFFDIILESAVEGINMVDLRLSQIACEKLGIKPCDATLICLDDTGYDLKVARELGFTCIVADGVTEAVKKLQEIVEIQLVTNVTTNKVVHLPPVTPNDVPHAVASLKSGINIHYVEMGEGPVVILLHGFPDLWYSWRYQIPALASSGYRVIAIDLRGFGGSTAPYPVSEYSQKNLCRDVLDFMDFMGICQAATIGHDWGGRVVWNLALSSPHRLVGACAITTPLYTGEGYRRMQADIKLFDYQKYFHEEGKAEKEFERQISKTFKVIYRGCDDEKISLDVTNVRERGGLLVGYPDDIPKDHLISEDDLSYYVQQYTKSGFRGPLNVYRNGEANKIWSERLAHRKIKIPALMITASHDFVLRPEFTLDMEDRIVNLDRCNLQRGSHWVHMERPDQVNDALIHWLDKIHKREAN